MILVKLAVAYALYFWGCSYIYDHTSGFVNVVFGLASWTSGLPLPFLFVVWLDWRADLRAKMRTRAPSLAGSVTEVKLDPKMEVFEIPEDSIRRIKTEIARLEAEIRHEWALWGAIRRQSR